MNAALSGLPSSRVVTYVVERDSFCTMSHSVATQVMGLLTVMIYS